MNRKVDLGVFLAACLFAILTATASGVMVGQTMSALAALNTACAMTVTEAGK